MASALKTIEHPTFGPCEIVPSIVAIRWRTPVEETAATAMLSRASLKLAALRSRRDTKQGRDPAAPVVNQSKLLSWAAGTRVTDASLKKLATDPNIEWVGPVCRAVAAEPGERSYFGINPTVLVLSAQAAAAVDMASVDPSVSVDEARTSVMKGFVVYRAPAGNAIEVAQKLQREPAIRGLANAVSLENIPYLSPICGCTCVGSSVASDPSACAPSATAIIPNDTLFPNQWGLQRIDAPRAWPISMGDPNIVVAVLDQGVELAHPDLHLWPISYSTITHTNDGGPVGNHGTPCAGIIASNIQNGLGAAGLAPQCRVMAIATNFADTEVAEGLFFAADNGARVVSMSFGVYPSWMFWNFAIIEVALQYCYERNVVLVAATGNENQPVSRFPATDPRTFGVGGSNRDDVRKRVGDGSIESFWGACYGPDCDVVAPCLEIPSTDRLGAAGYTVTDYTLRFNGTSAATPHVAALAALVLSVDGSLSNTDVMRLISESADKINAGGYVYLPTAGKPHGTWNPEAGYGRINAERAVLLACAEKETRGRGTCAVDTPAPDPCCVSPCDPAWRPDENCLTRYEDRFFRLPLGRDAQSGPRTGQIEFRITYEHRMCLLGKQHGPLLYTTTLLPGETIRLYHSDRYRRITSTQQRFSVQTTFMQFLSVVHQARISNSLDTLTQQLEASKSASSSGSGGGFFFGLFGWGGGGSDSSSSSSSSLTAVSLHAAAEAFSQSVEQASQLTHAERSIVVSSYEERDTVDVTMRTLHNANECRAVTYFVRQVMELYAISTRVADLLYRIVAPNVPPDWHAIDDVAWLPPAVRTQLQNALALLPRPGQVIIRPRAVSLPTDGVVYDPELAHCCSCEPERAAAIQIRLEKAKAEALKACLEAKELELELQRRSLLLAKGQLEPFVPVSPAPPTP